MLVGLVKRGVKVRGMVWRSHPKVAGFHLEHHLELSQQVNDAGGLVLLDQRVRPAGSHHQKLVLLRHATHTERDLAFVGGIDLCHGRRDDARHLGDPQVEELDEQYGPRPPWHDIQIAVSGPAVGDLDLSFRERWNDPTPLADRRTPWRALISRLAKQPERRDRLPEQGDDPEPAGESCDPGAPDLSGQTPAVSVRQAGRTKRGARLSIFVLARPMCDLRRRPIPLVPRSGSTVRRRPTARAGAARDGGGAAGTGPQRSDLGAAASRGSAGSGRPVARRWRRPLRHLRSGERGGCSDLRPCQDRGDRRCVGRGGIRQPEPPFLDA